MKIISWNVNGLRSPSMSVIKNGGLNPESNLYKLILENDPDILCLQETKCQEKNQAQFDSILPFNYKVWNSSTEKLGYSGVSVFSKQPFNILTIPKLELDTFGRYLVLEFASVIVCCVYVPNSKNKDEYRKDWDTIISEFLSEKFLSKKPVVYCGDLNVVSDTDDIYNPLILKRGNSPGTKIYERNNFKDLLNLGYTDAHRSLYPADKLWTWWDYKSKSRDKDNGWRLDYFLVNNSSFIKSGRIHKEIYGSDHCPISLELI
jgi:exodeoxyribonuclease III